MEDKCYPIFKNAPCLILLIYEDGILKDCNDRIFDFLGYNKEEVINKNIKMFFAKDNLDKVNANLDLISSTKELLDEEYNMLKKDGDRIYVTIKSAISTDEKGRKSTICFIADITKQKEIQIQLQKSNEELEEFAYVASHDLQEPLRVVASYCQLLKDKNYPGIDEDGLKYIDYSISSALRMRTLIKELLDYSRVGRTDKPFEYVDIREIIQEVIADYQMAINDSDAKIIIEGDIPVLFTIRFRMKQLISNLFSNALKFKSEKLPVIQIGVCKKEDAWLFYVKDNGIGIESQYFDRIFGIFKRLYSRDEYPGTGIGLAICKRIVEAHRGKIWVDSDGKTGTCIYFTIAKHINFPEVISL